MHLSKRLKREKIHASSIKQRLLFTRIPQWFLIDNLYPLLCFQEVPEPGIAPVYAKPFQDISGGKDCITLSIKHISLFPIQLVPPTSSHNTETSGSYGECYTSISCLRPHHPLFQAGATSVPVLACDS